MCYVCFWYSPTNNDDSSTKLIYMTITWQKVTVGIVVVAVIVFAIFAAWFLFFRTSGTPTVNQNGSVTQNSQSQSTGSNGAGSTQTVSGGVNTNAAAQNKIFELAQGPVEDATFIQTFNPTTTLARYVMQDSGHVFDIPVDVPGAVARVVSNTTIPGLGSALWLNDGVGAVIQYTENGVIKTVSLEFSTDDTSASSSVSVHFLPDSIVGLAASPDGKSLVYLLAANSGVTGYLARADGSSPVKLFSSPLSQVLLSWPSKNTLLLQTKEAAGVPGIAFEVSAQTGAMTPLVYAQSLSASANPSFSKLIYQTASGSTARTTYAHDVASGKDLELPFNPLPEKCAWSSTSATLLYCAAPLTSTPANYLDLWHQGLEDTADSIFAFDIGQGITSVVAVPGGAQGGVAADIASIHVSPDGQYLLFVTKGDRSLWGVRLTQ